MNKGVSDSVGLRRVLHSPGAAALRQAETPAAPTSAAVGASGWLGYSAAVPAPEDRREELSSGDKTSFCPFSSTEFHFRH